MLKIALPLLLSAPVQPVFTAKQPITAPVAIELQPPITVNIPANGNAKNAVQNVILRKHSTVPLTPPPTFTTTVTPHVTLPFECVGTDACSFNLMPFYNQLNANFAWVNLPDNYVMSQLGPTAWDAMKGIWGEQPSNMPGIDKYYNSWMPHGPPPGAAGTYGWLDSDICGPTAESMALMAAWNARSPTTTAVRGNWTQVQFLDAQTPSNQTVVRKMGPPPYQSPNQPPYNPPIPAAPPSVELDANGHPLTFVNPLKPDAVTLAPNQQQMTQQELQRVINLSIKQMTDPVTGGHFDTITRLGGDFVHATQAAHPVYKGQHGGHVDWRTMHDLIQGKNAVVLGIHWYIAHVSPDQSQMTFEYVTNSGHALALEAFEAANNSGSSGPFFVIRDPWYANRFIMKFTQIFSQNQTRNGKPMTVTLPDGNADLALLNYPSARVKPNVMGIDDIADGQEVIFADGWWSVWLE